MNSGHHTKLCPSSVARLNSARQIPAVKAPSTQQVTTNMLSVPDTNAPNHLPVGAVEDHGDTLIVLVTGYFASL